MKEVDIEVMKETGVGLTKKEPCREVTKEAKAIIEVGVLVTVPGNEAEIMMTGIEQETEALITWIKKEPDTLMTWREVEILMTGRWAGESLMTGKGRGTEVRGKEIEIDTLKSGRGRETRFMIILAIMVAGKWREGSILMMSGRGLETDILKIIGIKMTMTETEI